MNGYYEFKVSASTSASANACNSDRGCTTTITIITSSSTVEVGANKLRVLFSIRYVGVIVDNMSMVVSFAS